MKFNRLFLLTSIFLASMLLPVEAQDILTPAELLSMKSVSGLEIHPEGTEVLYTLSTPRGPNEEPGPYHRELFR